MWRIALLALLHRPLRVGGAVLGVGVGACLLWLPGAVYLGLRANASALVRHARADLWIADAHTEFVDQPAAFPRSRAAAIESHPCVEHASPMLVSYVPYRTASGGSDGLELVGAARASLPWSTSSGLPDDLSPLGTVSLDDRDRPTRTRHGIDRLEVADRELRVALRTHGIRSIGLTPIAFASFATAAQALHMPHGETHFVLVDARDEACIAELCALTARIPSLRAMTSDELASLSEEQLVTRSGIAVALGFVTVLGFAVAMAFVAQTLVSTLEESRRDLAMLGALGASRAEVVAFTAIQATALAALGTLLGAVVVALLVPLASTLAVALVLPPWLWAAGALVVLALCALAAVGALARAARIDAIEVLK